MQNYLSKEWRRMEIQLVYIAQVSNHTLKSMVFNRFVIALQCGQIISLFFLGDRKFTSSTQELKYMHNITSYLSFTHFNQSYPDFALSITLFCHLFIVFFMLIFIKGNNTIIRSTIQIFFSIYDWVLLIPFQQGCFNRMSDLHIILGVLQTILCFGFNFLSLYYFRTPGFNAQWGKNSKCFNPLFVSCLLQILLILSKFQPNKIQDFQILFLYIILALKLFETFNSQRFSYQNLNTFYKCNILSIIILFMLFNFEEYLGNIYINRMYFTLLLIIPILNQLSKLQKSFVFTESIYQLMISSKINNNKFQFFQLIVLHQQNCSYVKCECQSNSSQQLLNDTHQFNQFMKRLFKMNKKEEQVKYLSYILQHNENQIQNYQEYIRIKNSNKMYTHYENILRPALYRILKLQNQSTTKSDALQYSQLSQNLYTLEKYQDKIKETILALLQKKEVLWNKYAEDKIDSFQQLHILIVDILISEKNCKAIDINIEQSIQKQFKRKMIKSQSYFYLKYRQFQMIVQKYPLTQIELLEEQIAYTQQLEKNQVNKLVSSMFLLGDAVQLIVIISSNQRGEIIKQSNQFQNWGYINNINQLMPTKIQNIHDGILDKYLKQGQTKGYMFDSFMQINGEIINITINLSQLFRGNCLDSQNSNIQMLANIKRNYNQNSKQSYILIDSNFNVFGISQSINKLMIENLQEDLIIEQIDIFRLIPQISQQFVQFYSENQFNQRSTESYMILDPSIMFTKKMNQRPKFDQNNSTAILDYLQQKQNKKSLKKQISQNQKMISYSLENKQIEYLMDSQLLTFQYFQINVELIDEQDSKDHVEENQEVFVKVDVQNTIKFNETQQRTADVDNFRKSLQKLRLPTQILQLLIAGGIYIILQVIVLVLLIQLVQYKRNLQTLCFAELQYSTDFLDGYSRAMISSRHVIYMRDFNNFLASSNIYQLNTGQVNVTSYDKISFSLYIYRFSILDLIDYYERNLDKLDIYFKNQKNIELIRINIKYTDKQVEVVSSQGEYYQLMLQTFYMAIMSFAKDPTLYLQGKTDTFAQVNTRGILYLNFQKVAELTLAQMEYCQVQNKQNNYLIDNLIQILIVLFYVGFLIELLIMGGLYLRILNKRKHFFKIFIRTSQNEALDELRNIQGLIKFVQNNKIWISNYSNEEQTRYESNTNEIKIGKQIKSYIEYHLNYRLIFLVLLALIILNCAFLVPFQISYQNYSKRLEPLVSAALSSLYIRLQFIDTTNKWDVLINHKFYGAMIEIYKTNPPKDSRYNLFTENIRHGYNLLGLIEINQTLLEQNIQKLLQEPYSELVYKQISGNIDGDILQMDLCFLPQFNCDLKDTTYKGRIYTEQFEQYFKVGIINLFKNTVQVMIENPFFNLTDPYEIVKQFEATESSFYYFLYFLWGFDATLFQNKLFSDYFVQQSEINLQNQTNSVFSVLIYSGIIILCIQIIVIFIFDKQVIKQYQQTLQCLRMIPSQTIINKKLMTQLNVLFKE